MMNIRTLCLALFIIHFGTAEDTFVKYYNLSCVAIDQGDFKKAMISLRIGYNSTFGDDNEDKYIKYKQDVVRKIQDSTLDKSKNRLILLKSLICLRIAGIQKGKEDKHYQMQFEECELDLNKVIASDPSIPESYNHLAIVKLYRGEYLKALDLYNKAIELSPGYIDAIRNRAAVFRILGEKEKEEQDMVLYHTITQNADIK